MFSSLSSRRFEELGVETDHGPIVAVNAHASDPHYEPNCDKISHIRRGDVVLIDLWAETKIAGCGLLRCHLDRILW